MVMYWLVFLFVLNVALASNERALQRFAQSNNLFAAAVYKEITKNNNDNFLVSPYSLETVLAFVHSGCKGNSAEEIRRGLRLINNKNKIETGVKDSLSHLNGHDLYTLRTANKMYVKHYFSINQDFKRTATEIYEADIEPINFVKKYEAADTMNRWVEEKTNNKIKNLIDPNVLDMYTRAILINALYFKGEWRTKFSDRSTWKGTFYKTAGNAIEVDMMHQYREWYKYYESPELNAKFLELPFRDDNVTMVLVLPNENEGLRQLESQIQNVLQPQSWKQELVNIVIPKFKIESTIPFVDILKNLGIESVFDEKRADLSGIAGNPGDLIINNVLQKTYIEVEEGGVEAAAATYVGVAVPISAESYYDKPKNFVADHPFIFYIKAKDFIIFAGRVTFSTQ